MTPGLTTKTLFGQIVNRTNKVCTPGGSTAENNRNNNIQYDFQDHVIGGAASNYRIETTKHHTMYPHKILTTSRLYYYYTCREDSKQEIGDIRVVCVNFEHKNLPEKKLSECTELLYKYIHNHNKKFHRSVVMCLSHITSCNQNNHSNDTQQDQIYIHLKSNAGQKDIELLVSEINSRLSRCITYHTNQVGESKCFVDNPNTIHINSNKDFASIKKIDMPTSLLEYNVKEMSGLIEDFPELQPYIGKLEYNYLCNNIHKNNIISDKHPSASRVSIIKKPNNLSYQFNLSIIELYKTLTVDRKKTLITKINTLNSNQDLKAQPMQRTKSMHATTSSSNQATERHNALAANNRFNTFP
ncbi:MAG: hypothetical protein QG673_1517 [Pseudomonadota bacterium]|nr:hypothetical protein [Pseudomonadota bacterium]